MAVFTAEEFGKVIKRCWLDGTDITRFITRINIPVVEDNADMPPATGWLIASGSVDILNVNEEMLPIDGFDRKLKRSRHYGIIKLEWFNA